MKKRWDNIAMSRSAATPCGATENYLAFFLFLFFKFLFTNFMHIKRSILKALKSVNHGK